MIRKVTAGALLIIVCAAVIVAATAANRTASQATRGRLVLWSRNIGTCQGLRLLRVNPNSLRVMPGKRLVVPDASGGPTLSPDHKLAVLDGYDHGRLAFVDLDRMRSKGEVRLGGWPDYAQTLAWPRRRTLVALDVDRDAHRVALTKVAVVDPIARRIVRELRFPWWADLGHGTTSAGRTAILLVSWTRLTSPRLVVVEPDGTIRKLRVPGFAAGVGSDRIGEVRRFPALAVDPRHERAYVALEREPTAVIDLRTLRVRYRHFRLPAPARSEAGPTHGTGTNEPTHGPQREAAWLGGGKFVLTGFDSSTHDGGERDAGAGLTIVDTRAGSVRTIRRGIFSLQPGASRVVAIGYSPKPTDRLPESLFLLSPTGRLIRAIRVPNGWSIVAGQIAVPRRRGHQWQILDPASGKRVGEAPLLRVQRLQFGYCG